MCVGAVSLKAAAAAVADQAAAAVQYCQLASPS